MISPSKCCICSFWLGRNQSMHFCFGFSWHGQNLGKKDALTVEVYKWERYWKGGLFSFEDRCVREDYLTISAGTAKHQTANDQHLVLTVFNNMGLKGQPVTQSRDVKRSIILNCEQTLHLYTIYCHTGLTAVTSCWCTTLDYVQPSSQSRRRNAIILICLSRSPAPNLLGAVSMVAG